MSRRRRLYVAGALVGAFGAGLVWLPSTPAAFGLGTLLGLAGVCLLDKPRWRTAALVAAAVNAGFALIELAADLAVTEPADAGVVIRYTPSDWLMPDAVLGYRLRPGTVVAAHAMWRDETVYSRSYTIDATGGRATPNAAPTGDTYLFIGDSFVFGLGLADNETLPARVAQAVGPAAHVVNLGVPGYGLNQLVRALETGAYDGHVTSPVKAVVTWLIPAQLARVRGDAEWLRASPRYVLDAAGAPVFTGSFDAHRLADPLAGLAWLAAKKMRSLSIATDGAAERESAELFVALLRRLAQLTEERYKAPLVVIYQWPLPRPTVQDAPQLLSTLEAIERLDTPLVTVSSLIEGDQPSYVIPHDGHPSAPFVRIVAKALEARLGF